MNLVAIQQTIYIMTRAGRVNMLDFQSSCEILRSEEQLHHCGTSACLAGWIAVSPEWKAIGGLISSTGYPVSSSGGACPEHAIAKWWDVPVDLVDMFIYGPTVQVNKTLEQITFGFTCYEVSCGSERGWTDCNRLRYEFYPVPWGLVGKEEVLARLRELASRDPESLKYDHKVQS